MSDKLTEYIGCSIKIKCDKFICSGEIVALDQNTVLITKAFINDLPTSTKFLGINHDLIHDVDITRFPGGKDNSKSSIDINTALNVYKSETKPPAIKRGGSSSAVHRNLMKTNNIPQDKIHKSRSSIFPSNNGQSGASCFEPARKGELCVSFIDENPEPQMFNLNGDTFRNRNTCASTPNKNPSGLNNSFNDKDSEFYSNFALHNKTASTNGLNSSMSNGGKNSILSKRNKENILIETTDFPTHDEELSKSFTDFITQIKNPKESNIPKDENNKSIYSMNNGENNRKEVKTNGKSKEVDQTDKYKLPGDITESIDDLEVYTELKRLGILPARSEETGQTVPAKKCDQETQISSDNIRMDRSFLQQPDIVQEVTKSKMCNSESLIPEQSNILSVTQSSKDFQHFYDFWKLDNDSKFPVFSISQKDKLLECANKFGYDVREIAEHVGQSLSKFVIEQLGGVSRLSRLNIPQIPKIAVILSKCQASVFVTSMARFLVTSGCYVLAYVDDTYNEPNEDVDKEIDLLRKVFIKYTERYGFNCLTENINDLKNKQFDYIISGLENESSSETPNKDWIDWSVNQKSPILSINPPKISSISWKLAAFVGVPTTKSKDLVIRTKYERENGLLKPRSDGIRGLETDKMLKNHEGLVFLFNSYLPQDVYNLLSLNFKSPFGSENWIRLFGEKDSCLVE